MAEKISLVESFLNCHVCSETFRDPVSLSCNHSFCSSCLQKFWEQAENKNCPICKRKPLNDDPEVNLTLKKLADSFAERQKSESSQTEKKKNKEEFVCDKHPDVSYWFCKDEERAVCPVCEFSLHQGHQAVPVEQAVSELKEQLKSDLKSLQDKRDKYKQLEETYSEVNDHSMKQLLSTEKQIRAEFNKLHQFLKEEEESRLAALREEEEQTRKTVSREMKMIEEQISSLSDIISAVEENLQKHSVSFLSSYKPTQTRARDQCSLSDPQLVSGALIDVAKHLGNLSSRVCEKMKDKVHFSPVILDPNTANCSLYMSDELTSVRHEDIKQELPDNPESHTNDITVHGSEGFSSGKHSWEVKVGYHASWNVSLAKELVDRKEEEKASPKDGICCFTHRSGECIDAVGETDTVKENLQRNSCKRKPLSDDPEVNLPQKELANSFAERQKSELYETETKKRKEDVVCDKHPDVSYWFCEVEERAVCPICEFSLHRGHRLVAIEQLVSKLKEQLKYDLKSLQDKRDKYKQVEKTYNEVIQHTKKQLLSTEKQIRAEFNKLHQFLKEEQESRLAALREEEEQKGKTISREMKMIEEQISSLSDMISAVEEDLQKHNVSFLSSYKLTETRVRDQCSLSDPQVISGALIDVAKHLGNLSFRVWEKMKDKVDFSPVILDPNTANHWLHLSDDLTSVRYGDIDQQLPDNPERNTMYAYVHGSEGFSSGKHSWEVEVGDHPDWTLGLAKESADRKGDRSDLPEYGVWCLTYDNGEYIDVVGETVRAKKRLQRIRVHLDYDRGEVSFYNTEDMTQICRHIDTFTEKLFPYFNIGKAGDAQTADIKIRQTKMFTFKGFAS